jgi:hypothetical protein
MQIRSDKALTPIGYIFTASFGFGMCYGVIRSFRLGLVAEIASSLAIFAICWSIFRSGKKASYANAQSWAQAQVDVQVQVYQLATSEAKALSNAYSTAISNASAVATQQITIDTGALLELIANGSKLLTGTEEKNEIRTTGSLTMATKELHAQESPVVRSSDDRQISQPLQR